MGNIVSNNYLASDLPAITSTTSTQVYRNSDYKYFRPTLLVATNKHVSTTSLVHLTDADKTDSGEDTYAGSTTTYVKYLFAIGPLDTIKLDEKDLQGLVFRYGVCALLDAANATGVEIYIAGEEISGA